MKLIKKTEIKLLGHNIILSYLSQNNVFSVKNISNNYFRRDNFNYLYIDFNNFFKDEVCSKSSIDLDKSISVLEKTEKIEKSFETIKKYANSSELSIDFAKEVLDSYKYIYEKLEERYSWMTSDYYIVPLRGGGIVTKLFSLEKNRVFEIEAKRIPLKRGIYSFGFGLNFNYKDNPDYPIEFMSKLNGKVVTILEVCIASGMTTIGFLLDLYAKKVSPKKIIILTSSSSSQGIKVVQKVAKELNFNIEFITGMIIGNLGNYYDVSQDSLIYEDGLFVVKSPEKAYELIK